MIRKDGTVNMDFVRHVNEQAAVAWLDDDEALTVLGITQLACDLIHSIDSPDDVDGRSWFDLVANSSALLRKNMRLVRDGVVSADQWVMEQDRPIRQMCRIADAFGLGTSWIWLVSLDGTLTRCLWSLRKLDRGYGMQVTPLEDPTHRCWVKLRDDGLYEDDFGALYSKSDVEIIDLFMAGLPYDQIAKSMDFSAHQVRRAMERLAEKAGFNTPGEFRSAIWGKHAEEIMVSNQQMVYAEGHHFYN